MAIKKILLVEDEPSLAELIKLNLEAENYEVSFAANGLDALDIFNSNSFNLVILDAMIPGMSGFDVCKNIRKQNTKVPIMFLTARKSSIDRVQGLKLGADDYLTKPFNLEEFLLRVQILVKRSLETPKEINNIPSHIHIGTSEINLKSFQSKDIYGNAIQLSKKEIALLKILYSKKGEVVSRDEILDAIWPDESNPSSRTIDNFILAFRKHFEPNPKEPIYFHSVRGVGYKFTPDSANTLP
jgi:two-component system alkaline phosphatase synthesis response regulator PhoP